MIIECEERKPGIKPFGVIMAEIQKNIQKVVYSVYVFSNVTFNTSFGYMETIDVKFSTQVRGKNVGCRLELPLQLVDKDGFMEHWIKEFMRAIDECVRAELID